VFISQVVPSHGVRFYQNVCSHKALFDLAAGSWQQFEKCLFCQVSGFSEKLGTVLETVQESLVNFSVSEDVFEQQRLLLVKDYYNRLLYPHKLCKDLRLTILEQQRFSLVDKYAASHHLTRERLVSFVKQYVEDAAVDGLIQGNLDRTQALAIVDKLRSGIRSDHQYNLYRNERVLTIPECSPLIKVRGVNANDENSMVTMYLQFGRSSVDRCVLAELIHYMMCEPCFDILRTKKQLGYSVYVEDHDTAGVVGLTVNVQTQRSKFSVEQVTKDIVEFLEVDFYRMLKEMPEDEFESHVFSLIDLKNVEDNRLVEEIDRNWAEIVSSELFFGRLQSEIKRLESVTFDEVVKFYEDHCLRRARRLTLQVQGNVTPPIHGDVASPPLPASLASVQLNVLDSELDIAQVKGQEIRNISAFKATCAYYPVCFLKM